MDDKIKTIITKDEESGCLAAHVVEQKGTKDQWAVERTLDDIKMFGHTDIILKCDGEPALVEVQDEVIARRTAGTVPQNPPAYDPQANGSVERGVQEFMNQMRALMIGLEQRIQMKINTKWKILEWMVELAPTLINRCLVGHDGKTPYARLMGKNSDKEIVEIGEKVLAKISRGKNSKRKQALQTRWKEAIWVGVAKQSNEHIVVLLEGGQAIRCRTVKRRPLDSRWDGEAVSEIKATPRRPNPKEPNEKHIKIDTNIEVQKPEQLEVPKARKEEEVVRRNFRITKRILEKYGHTSGCPGCEADMEGRDKGGRGHTRGCRERIEKRMLDDPEEKEFIKGRDRRMVKSTGNSQEGTKADVPEDALAWRDAPMFGS